MMRKKENMETNFRPFETELRRAVAPLPASSYLQTLPGNTINASWIFE